MKLYLIHKKKLLGKYNNEKKKSKQIQKKCSLISKFNAIIVNGGNSFI